MVGWVELIPQHSCDDTYLMVSHVYILHPVVSIEPYICKTITSQCTWSTQDLWLYIKIISHKWGIYALIDAMNTGNHKCSQQCYTVRIDTRSICKHKMITSLLGPNLRAIFQNCIGYLGNISKEAIKHAYIDGLVQDSSMLAMEILQSCTTPLILPKSRKLCHELWIV